MRKRSAGAPAGPHNCAHSGGQAKGDHDADSHTENQLAVIRHLGDPPAGQGSSAGSRAKADLLRTWIDYHRLRLELYAGLGLTPP